MNKRLKAGGKRIGSRRKVQRKGMQETGLYEGKDMVRLNKYMAACGVCSRREADKLIEQGKVLINGKTALMGQTVNEGDEVCVNGKIVQGGKKKVVLAYYKPLGVVCTERDSHAPKKISDLISYPVRVTYAGRLDKDSEGLLLLSNDGDLIHAMMRGSGCHEKEYLVRTDREITPDFLLKMSQGVYLKDLDLTTRNCKVSGVSKYVFRIVLTQGVNRQIRRMCQAFGYRVKSLKRVRVMNITLDGLRYGAYRELTEAELEQLYREAGMKYAGAQHTVC